jgi:hypothetical protein
VTSFNSSFAVGAFLPMMVKRFESKDGQSEDGKLEGSQLEDGQREDGQWEDSRYGKMVGRGAVSWGTVGRVGGGLDAPYTRSCRHVHFPALGSFSA